MVVRRRVNCPELGSDPHLFASAGRSFNRWQTLKIPLHHEGVARSDGVVAVSERDYPARWAPLRHEGEFFAFGIHSPFLEGVTRSDGVAVFAINIIAT